MSEDNSEKKNPVAKVDGAHALTRAGRTAYGEYARAAGAGGQLLLKFTKYGAFEYGREGEELPKGKRLIAHMPELEVGYQHWVDGHPEEWVGGGRLREGHVPPPRHTLPHTDKALWESFDDGRPKDPLVFTNKLPISDPETGESYTFTTSSKGGLGAVGQLCEAYDALLISDPDSGKLPIIELGSNSYSHRNREYGKILFPTFAIVGWTGEDDREPEPAKLAPPPATGPASAPTAKRKVGAARL